MRFCQDIFVCCFFQWKMRNLPRVGRFWKVYGASFEVCFRILIVFFKKIIFSNTVIWGAMFFRRPLTMQISGIMYSWWTNKTSRKHQLIFQCWEPSNYGGVFLVISPNIYRIQLDAVGKHPIKKFKNSVFHHRTIETHRSFRQNCKRT